MSASLPPLVTWNEPMRMRIPLAPAVLRAGGSISAGMISTVQTLLPIFAATVPNICPAVCAPSPESEMISTMCSGTFLAVGAPVAPVDAPVVSVAIFFLGTLI
jgi:hypothetical protein